MGLDMYLEGRTFIYENWKNPEKNLKKDGYRVKGMTLELGYWRKHPNLHGYIVNTFAGGVDECQDIYLSADNLRQIIEAIKNKELPHTEGFFFGESDGSEDAESIEILSKAIEWMEEGDKPVMPKPENIGGGLTVYALSPETLGELSESRDVVYKASW